MIFNEVLQKWESRIWDNILGLRIFGLNIWGMSKLGHRKKMYPPLGFPVKYSKCQLSIDHFHICFEMEALSLTQSRAMMLNFFHKQTLHNFSTITKLTVVFRIEK